MIAAASIPPDGAWADIALLLLMILFGFLLGRKS